jgi:hypothetical protein
MSLPWHDTFMSAPTLSKTEAADYTTQEIDTLLAGSASVPVLETDEEAFALGLAVLRRLQDLQRTGQPYEKEWVGAFGVMDNLGGTQNHFYPMVAISQGLLYIMNRKVILLAKEALSRSNDTGFLQTMHELHECMDNDPKLRQEIFSLSEPYVSLAEDDSIGLDF